MTTDRIAKEDFVTAAISTAAGSYDASGAAAAAQSAAIAAAATDATTKANAAAAASQPLDSDLTAFAGLAIAADKLPYGTGSHTLGLADFTSAGRALVDDADASAQRTTLGLGTLATQSGTFSGTSSGTNTGDQTSVSGNAGTVTTNANLTGPVTSVGNATTIADAELAALAGLTSAADKLPYFTGSGTATLADLTTFGRSLIDDAAASNARTTLGLVIGTDVQAQNADLAAVAAATALSHLTLPTAAESTAGRIRENSTTHAVTVYDSQRERVVGPVGWVPYAYPVGFDSAHAIATATTLAAAGGSVACPIFVPGHMLLQALQYRQGDASLLRQIEWQLYVQYLNNGNSGENTLTAVTGATGTDSLTAAGAATRTSAVTSPPIYLGPGVYWCVVRNTHATNSFAILGMAAGTMQNNQMQTKTLGSALGSTLDFVAASWTKVGSSPLALILQGRVFGEATAF